jgi:large subunit ribosomal protein L22
VPGVKTNEREGTRAVLRHSRMSAYKARQVLDQIRNQDVDRAAETLDLGDREAAGVIGKVLASAVANAVHNDGLDAEELFVSACYADEGSTLKRWRPRARGRATRIRKRTCHITIIVSRMPDERIARRRAKANAAGSQRSRRVAGSRRQRGGAETDTSTETPTTIETDETELAPGTEVVDGQIEETGIDGDEVVTETEAGPLTEDEVSDEADDDVTDTADTADTADEAAADDTDADDTDAEEKGK